MKSRSMRRLLQITTALSFLLMVAVNALANTLPINGVTTGEVSDAYENLFAPAAFTFAIWGVIYITLTLYVLFQFGLFRSTKRLAKREMLKQINIAFIPSSLVNVAWILSWHYDIIFLSLFLMLLLLLLLVRITRVIQREHLSKREYFFVKLPFSIYFGWITVATIANVTTYLVSIDWQGWGLSEEIWMIIVLIVGAVILLASSIRDSNPLISLVAIWSYAGILFKHVSASAYDGEYMEIIVILLISLVLFTATAIWTTTRSFVGASTKKLALKNTRHVM